MEISALINIFECFSDPIYTVNRGSRLIYLKKAAATLLGLEPENAEGSALKFFPNQMAKRLSTRIKDMFQTGKSSLNEGTLSVGNKTLYQSTSLNPTLLTMEK